jgi:hypothetical protein
MKKNQTKLIAIMKITLAQVILIATFSTFSFANEARSQDILKRIVTVEASNKALKNVLMDIEKEAAIHFAYLPQIVEADKIVSVSAKKQTLAYTLERVFAPLSIQYEVSGNYIILSKAKNDVKANNLPTPVVEPTAIQVSGTV